VKPAGQCRAELGIGGDPRVVERVREQLLAAAVEPRVLAATGVQPQHMAVVAERSAVRRRTAERLAPVRGEPLYVPGVQPGCENGWLATGSARQRACQAAATRRTASVPPIASYALAIEPVPCQPAAGRSSARPRDAPAPLSSVDRRVDQAATVMPLTCSDLTCCPDKGRCGSPVLSDRRKRSVQTLCFGDLATELAQGDPWRRGLCEALLEQP